MDGILLIDKPQGFTSFDVVAKLRGILKTRKIGHAGTLDPMATGVLPVFLGSATKACDILPNSDKAYRAVLRLGIRTDTLDRTGTVIAKAPVTVGASELKKLLPQFTGTILQVPPMYSAVKIGGRKLCDLARQGKEIERPSRQVTIRSIHLIQEAASDYTLLVECSKGTYIRTLCDDLGQALGCGAVLMELTRTQAAGYALEDCHTLQEIEAARDAGTLEQWILPVHTAFSRLPQVVLERRDAFYFCNGLKMQADRFGCRQLQGLFCVLAQGEIPRFLGLGYVDEMGLLRVKKLFSRLEEKPGRVEDKEGAVL